jgi:hypothetical protein
MKTSIFWDVTPCSPSKISGRFVGSWLLLCSCAQSSWLQIQRSGFYSWRCQIFWELVGLERGPLSLVSTFEEQLGRNISGFGLENWEYGRGNPLCWPRDTFYAQKLALTSPTNSRRSVDTVHSRTNATEFVVLLVCLLVRYCCFLLHARRISKDRDKLETDSK